MRDPVVSAGSPETNVRSGIARASSNPEAFRVVRSNIPIQVTGGSARVTGDVSARGPRPPFVKVAPVGAGRHEAGFHEKIVTQRGRLVPTDDERKPRNIGGLKPLVPRVQNERKTRRFREIPAYREQVEILRLIERGEVALPIDAERTGAPTGKQLQEKNACEHKHQPGAPDFHRLGFSSRTNGELGGSSNLSLLLRRFVYFRRDVKKRKDRTNALFC